MGEQFNSMHEPSSEIPTPESGYTCMHACLSSEEYKYRMHVCNQGAGVGGLNSTDLCIPFDSSIRKMPCSHVVVQHARVYDGADPPTRLCQPGFAPPVYQRLRPPSDGRAREHEGSSSPKLSALASYQLPCSHLTSLFFLQESSSSGCSNR